MTRFCRERSPQRHIAPIAVAVALAAVALLHVNARTLSAQAADAFTTARLRLVREDIAGAGVTNERVLEAMRNTPRHEFVAIRDRQLAYFDMALPIGDGQTISPPFIVAYMTEQLDPQPTDRVLEIGTGSGYQAAVLSPLVAEVYTIEIVDALSRSATRVLERLGYKNVHTRSGDGYLGWPEAAPFDKIIVTCSPENVPQPLIDQLKEGGRLIVPLGQRFQQTFYLFRKVNGELVKEALRPTLFVPMTGRAEDERQVFPNPLEPTLVNGGFEEFRMDGDAQVPLGYHYARQYLIVEDRLAPEGTRFIRFANDVPGRPSQALQGFGIDGRKVSQLELSFRVRTDNVRPGQSIEELPVLAVMFYDGRREMVGQRVIGPWRGSFEWSEERVVLAVPPRAETGIIRLGLFGGLGQVDFDAVQVRAVTPAK